MKRIFLVVVMVIFCSLCITVEAQGYSYIMMDVKTNRILKGSNYHNKSLVASTAKIMTCIVGLENGSLFDLVKVEKEDTLMEGSKIYIEEDDEILYMDLLYGLMLRSGNDAANAIGRSTFDTKEEFIVMMNETAKKIGMKNSTFTNPSGLDAVDFNLSTAYDMALLTSYAMQNEYFKEIAGTKKYVSYTKNEKVYYWYNKHKLVTGYKEFIGGKTGYTKKAGRILVSVAEVNNTQVVIVTINDPNDWQTHKRLSEQVKSYKSYKIVEKGVYDSYIEDLKYFIEVKEDVFVSLNKKEISKLKVKFLITNEYCQMVIYLDNDIIKTLDVGLIKKE